MARGGARPGAGRKSELNKKEPVFNLIMPESLIMSELDVMQEAMLQLRASGNWAEAANVAFRRAQFTMSKFSRIGDHAALDKKNQRKPNKSDRIAPVSSAPPGKKALAVVAAEKVVVDPKSGWGNDLDHTNTH